MSLDDLRDTLASTRRLVRTVDALTDEELLEESLLPRWSRGHVVAHLALNAEGMARALAGLAQGEQVPMYASDEARDADIDELASDGPTVLREALMAGCTHFQQAVEDLPADRWSATFPRVPGGPAIATATLVAARRREVEIHHADLGAAYSPADWPEDFVTELLDVLTLDHAEDGPFEVRPSDLPRNWTVGAGTAGDGGRRPVVSGSGADLAWWLSGRGQGGGLSADPGDLPRIGPWRRTPAR